MKCPKCSYLGFDAGDRCKNCGYDFSLLVPSAPDAVVSDLPLRSAATDGGPRGWQDQFDVPIYEESARPMTGAAEPSLPLFGREADDDEAPLVRLPAAPRPPLAVRKTPNIPRPRAVTSALGRPQRDEGLAFEFMPESVRDSVREPVRAEPLAPEALVPSGFGPRSVAALIDHGILVAVDLAVVYFTLRMTALAIGDWRALPAAPLLAFLLFVKLAYFSAFTSVGGQTIGKMAARIRVVADTPGRLGVSRAMRRALAGVVSVMPLGAGLLPAFFSADHRAFHDRVSQTRVVALPSA